MEAKLKGNRWEKGFEEPLYAKWKKEKAYKFEKGSKKPVFSLDTPPPYVNTPIHIGQATTYVLMDMFARFKRMTGWNVLFPLGLDRNGLPIEMAAEKKFNLKLTDISREKALKLCESILQESSMKSIDTFLRSGISFNSWTLGNRIGDVYYTDSPEYRSLTQGTFIDLWKKGLIYEDSRVTNFCPGCQTTIADAEVEYSDLATIFNDIKFKVKETGEEIIIGTTRPELICTCGMVIFNPKDKRYKHIEGKTALTPIFNKEVPIKAHPMAEIEKGTGLVMMCSAGDLSDIRFFREMRIEPVIAINKDGTMNKHAGFLEGLKVEEARKKMIEVLREKGLLVKQAKTTHRTPVCERSKDQIEFIAMPEFYLKQLEFKPKMKEFSKMINFYAPRSRQILLDWIESVSIDWPVSRRRYYATDIPLWYCKKCNKPIIPPKGKYYRPWKEKPPIKKCPKCGNKEFKGETRVFDTWFDSSISPLYILKYSRDNKFFEKAFPCTLRPSGKEILRNWGYYTILRCYQLTGKCIFKDHWVNYHILDEKGHKMSKSKGNVIDPQKVIDRFGAEPFRLWAVLEGDLTKKDFRCSFERIEGMAKFLTKLWNVARFVSMFSEPKKCNPQPADKWILAELEGIVKFTRKCYEGYNFHDPMVKIKNFIWETFASHYIELVKSRAYNGDNKFSKEEQDAACGTLYTVLETLLRIMAPVIPFITARVYTDIWKKDIHRLEFPKPIKLGKLSFKTEELMEMNSAVWKAKKDKGLSLKTEVKGLTIPDKFKTLEKDIISAHNVKKIKYEKKVKIVL